MDASKPPTADYDVRVQNGVARRTTYPGYAIAGMKKKIAYFYDSEVGNFYYGQVCNLVNALYPTFNQLIRAIR